MDEIAAALNSINAISRQLTSSYNLNELLPQIIRQTREILHCNRVHLYLLNEAGDTLRLTAASSAENGETKPLEHTLPLDHLASPTARAVREARCIVGDSAGEPGNPTAPALSHLGSAMAAPIVETWAVGQVAIGSLTACSDQGIEPGSWAGEFLQAMANQAARAIIHARLIEEVREARRAVELSDQVKSEFLSRMSHELRTPLNGILGYTRILKGNPDLTPAQSKGLNVIQQSGEHLLALVNDILDLTEIETHTPDLHNASFNLNDFLQGIARMAGQRAQKKGLSVVLEAGPPLPESVCADEKRLRQALINLINNAIKFTERGTVTLRVQEIPAPRATEGVRMVRFAVTDTGTGIAPERLGRIFVPFEQTPDNKLPSEGAGLGLAISRHIVQMMGSELRVESEINHGSTFWFDMALPVDEACIPAPEAGSDLGIADPMDATFGTLADVELAPPQADLAVLYEIAKLGNMRKINEWAGELIEQDESYRSFAEKVQELARSFQKKQIVTLVERYLEV